MRQRPRQGLHGHQQAAQATLSVPGRRAAGRRGGRGAATAGGQAKWQGLAEGQGQQRQAELGRREDQYGSRRPAGGVQAAHEERRQRGAVLGGGPRRQEDRQAVPQLPGTWLRCAPDIVVYIDVCVA